MNSKQRRTLVAVFGSPTPSGLPWTDVESMLLAVGGRLIEGSGSRIKFDFNGKALAMHRPHPGKETKRYVVRIVRDFLEEIGVKP
jgi:hypothetical protein